MRSITACLPRPPPDADALHPPGAPGKEVQHPLALPLGIPVRVGLAEREWMDLVVVATHGHGAVARALVGSTASAVTRRAPCAMLLVPPRLWPGTEPVHDP